MKTRLLGLSLAAVLGLAGCARQVARARLVVLADDAGAYNGCARRREQVEGRLRALSARKDLDVVLRSRASAGVPPIALATYLDGILDNDPAWPPVRSIGFTPRAPKDSVEFILLTQPKFVTLRLGYSTRAVALSEGLLSGPRLAEAQRAGLTDPVEGMSRLIGLVETSLPDKVGDSKLERWRFAYADEISLVIENITLNHGSFYNRWLLRPMLWLPFALSGAMPQRVAALVALGTILAVTRLLIFSVGFVLSAAGLRWAALLFAVAVDWLTVIPCVGMLLLISRQRLEDRIFVKALLHADLSGWIPAFEGRTGFLWAIPFTLIGVLYTLCAGYLLEGKLSDDAAGKAVFSPFKYFFLFAFLPFAASLVWAGRLLVDFLAGGLRIWRIATR